MCLGNAAGLGIRNATGAKHGPNINKTTPIYCKRMKLKDSVSLHIPSLGMEKNGYSRPKRIDMYIEQNPTNDFALNAQCICRLSPHTY